MRSRKLLYILLIVAAAAVVAPGVQAAEVTIDDEDEGGGVEDPGCDEEGEDRCDGEGDLVGSGGTRDQGDPGCFYANGPLNPMGSYLDCLVAQAPTSSGIVFTYSTRFGKPKLYTISEPGTPEPDDVCYYEEDEVIQSTTAKLTEDNKEGRIRKFTEKPAGDGEIEITLNDVSITVVTFDISGALDLQELNDAVYDAVSTYFSVGEKDGYWEIYGIPGTPPKTITKVGVRSTDSNIFISGIAVVPQGAESGIPCAPVP